MLNATQSIQQSEMPMKISEEKDTFPIDFQVKIFRQLCIKKSGILSTISPEYKIIIVCISLDFINMLLLYLH